MSLVFPLEIQVTNLNEGESPDVTARYKNVSYRLRSEVDRKNLSNALLDPISGYYDYSMGVFNYGPTKFKKKRLHDKVEDAVSVDFGGTNTEFRYASELNYENPAKEIIRRVEMVKRAFLDTYPKVNIIYCSVDVPVATEYQFNYNGCKLTIRLVDVQLPSKSCFDSATLEWGEEKNTLHISYMYRLDKFRQLCLKNMTGYSSNRDGIFGPYPTEYTSVKNQTISFHHKSEYSTGWHFTELTPKNVNEKLLELRHRLDSFRLYAAVQEQLN